MFTLAFWRATFERAMSTASQAALLAIGTDVVEAMQVDAFHLDFARLGSYAAGGALLSVLKGIAAVKLGSSGPGFGTAETLTDDVAAEAEPASPTGLVAGPAADATEGSPVDVIEVDGEVEVPADGVERTFHFRGE